MPQKREGRPREPVAGELHRFKAQFFRALAHPTRIRILEALVRRGRTVQELQEELALGQPIVSQQLAVLRHQGIVSAQKEGASVRYALRDPLLGALLDRPGGFSTIVSASRRDCCASCSGSGGADSAGDSSREPGIMAVVAVESALNRRVF